MYRLDFKIYCRASLIECPNVQHPRPRELFELGNTREVPPISSESFYGLFGLCFGDQHIVGVPVRSPLTRIYLHQRDQPSRYCEDRDSGYLQRSSKVTHDACYFCPMQIQILEARSYLKTTAGWFTELHGTGDLYAPPITDSPAQVPDSKVIREFSYEGDLFRCACD